MSSSIMKFSSGVLWNLTNHIKTSKVSSSCNAIAEHAFRRSFSLQSCYCYKIEDRLTLYKLRKIGTVMSSGEFLDYIRKKGLSQFDMKPSIARDRVGSIFGEFPNIVVHRPVNEAIRKRQILSPLERAIKRKDLREIKKLVSEGIDVNVLGQRSRPPLFQAVRTGSLRVVELLMTLGADPSKCEMAPWNYNITAYHYAVQMRFYDITRLFVEKWGVPVNQGLDFNDYGWPPEIFDFAMLNVPEKKLVELEKILLFLLSKHGRKFIRNGWFLFRAVVENGMDEVAKLMVNLGHVDMNPDIADAWDSALRRKYYDLVRKNNN